MKYPKSGGKEFDSIRKKEFNKWRKLFRWTIGQAANHKGVALDSDVLTTAAWNCAFHVVTARTE